MQSTENSRKSIARLALPAAVLAAGCLALIGWSYLKVERGRAGRGAEAGSPSQPGPAAAAVRNAEVTKARDLLEAGDNAGAVAALDRALAAAPRDAEVLALQVRALRAQRRYTAARSTARRILDSFPRSPLAHLLLGSIAMQEGDATTARRDLERAVALDTSSALAVAQLGWLDLMEGKVVEARTRARQALALDPDNTMALRTLTRMSRSAPELRALFERLVKANPGEQLDRSWLEVLRATASPEVNYISPVDTTRTVQCETDSDGRLYLRARVGPFERLRLLVDTGASGLTLSETVARRMGMRLREFSQSAGVGGLTRHSHPILIDRIDLGGMRARAVMATASNLPPAFDGIVNPIIFAPPGSGTVVEIRAARRQIAFSRATGSRGSAPSFRDRWVNVPYLVDGNHIIFRIMLAGRPATALLDTGASVDMVDRSLLERTPGAVLMPANGMTGSLMGFGGAIEDAETVGQVTVRIAGRDFTMRHLFVVDLNDEAFRFVVDLDAIVGMTHLASFDLRIDPGGGLLSFRQVD